MLHSRLGLEIAVGVSVVPLWITIMMGLLIYTLLTISTFTLKHTPTAPKKAWRPTVHRKVFRVYQTPYIAITVMAHLLMSPLTAGVYNKDGKGMGVVFGDYDNDGDSDCYVGNDAGENFLYNNKGDGTFTNVGWMAGVEADENGNVQGTMGVDFGDYDNDGLLDLIAVNYQQQPNALYRNDNGSFFTDVSFVAGMADSLPYVGWGADFFDVDNDGDKDLLIANGHLQDTVEAYDGTTTYPQRNYLLINNGQGRFVDVSMKAGSGLASRKVSRGVATGDYDNDGDLDMLICNADDTPQLLRNDSGNQGNWILIRTIGTRSNRAGIGTRVKIQADDLTQIDEVRGGSGYLSQNDLRLHFGIGTHKRIDRIEARWPSGIVDIIRDVAPNQIITITEGSHSQ